VIERYSANLRISSDIVSATDISTILETNPDKSSEKGDLISSRTPKPAYRKHAIWILESGVNETEPLNKHLLAIARFLDDKKKQLPSLSNCHIDIFCGLFANSEQIGFSVDRHVIQALSKFPVDIVIDAYADIDMNE